MSRTIKHRLQNAISAPYPVTFFGLALLAMSNGGMTLHINTHILHTEIADSPAKRQQGLMHRFSLPADHAMLFVFDTDQRHCMWMRNTYIPLSVAFLDSEGVIINIASMKPLRDDSHCALMPARYALEVNEGWFSEKGVRVGARVIWGDIIHEE